MRTTSTVVVLVATFPLIGVSACGGDEITGPEPPAGALRFSTVTAGYFHSCGLGFDGGAYCWGANTWGTLGNGTTTASNRPVAVVGVRFASIESGAAHTCGVTRARGDIYCWGHNDEGQAADDYTNLEVREPIRLPGSRSWVDVSAGHDHSCGLTSDGEIWCWGDNITGQLGSGQSVSKSFEPLRVALDIPFSAVVAGYYQSCALTTAGRMYCWGRNDYGQLGDGTTENRFTPVAVTENLTFRTLGGGDAFMCGITKDGYTYCWGSNLSGELGNPDLGTQVRPVRVQGVPELQKVYGAGGAFTHPGTRAYACGLTDNGEAWCWGGAIRGELWSGPTDGPIRVEPEIRFRSLALGTEHLCGVTTDGWAFCGGGNYAGQLGDGTGQDRSSMVGVVRP